MRVADNANAENWTNLLYNFKISNEMNIIQTIYYNPIITIMIITRYVIIIIATRCDLKY